MKINILFYTEKKIAHPYKAAINEYIKRLARYSKIAVYYLKPHKTKQSTNKSYTIAITTGLAQISSEMLATKIIHFSNIGKSNITFVISDTLILADEYLALSQFSIDTKLQTIIVLEQIYRSFRIINNEPYHK